MSEVFDFREGNSALLVSIPHDGCKLAPGQAERMTAAGKELRDTDWHVRELYSFVDDLGASVIAANYSRYVVDLNRPPSDASLYGVYAEVCGLILAFLGSGGRNAATIFSLRKSSSR